MAVGAVKYWFNGLPLDGLSTTAGTVKYWFNGLPYDTLAPSAAPSGVTAVVNVTQADNTISAFATVTTPPTPTTTTQVFIDIQTAARSFTTRKRMF
jgi:hypothetical protein